MQVILLEDILTLGYKDDIVTVADGYGRNYLIPQGLAVIATEKAKKVLAENLKQKQHKLAAIKKEAEGKAEKMQNVKLNIKARTSKTGAIYGSVSSIQIAEELKKLGYDIDRKIILLKSPIKEVGEYTYQIHFHKEVQIELPVSVESENVKQIEAKDKKTEAKAENSKKEVEEKTDEAVAPDLTTEAVVEDKDTTEKE